MAADNDLSQIQARLATLRDNVEKIEAPVPTAASQDAKPQSDGTAQMPFKPGTGKTAKPESRKSAIHPTAPVGLDIGTSHVIVAQNDHNRVDTTKQLNAFFTLPKSKFAEEILVKNDVLYFEQGNLFYIFGFSAENFANMFNANTRRSIKKGILCAEEKEGIHVVKEVLQSLISSPKHFGETLCFGVPGEPYKGTGSVLYHESILKHFLESMGYAPISINEGMAVVISEMTAEDYTGIGISMGGGMCNVCLSYLSFPVITYSLQVAGDYIDEMAGLSVGEPATKVKIIKEQGLNLLKAPKDRLMTALHIFYEDIITQLLQSLQRILSSTDQIPMIAKPIPIVLSGGSAKPEGVRERFENVLAKYPLPVGISEVRIAVDPLNTTAKGALVMAMTEAR